VPPGAQPIPPLSVALATVPGGVVPVIRRSSAVVQPLPLMIVRPGKTLVRQGEVSAGAWRVETGILSVSLVTTDGRELMLDLIGPREVIGDPPGSAASCTVAALRPARLRAVGAGELTDGLAHRAGRTAALACDVAWLDVATRIERRLQDLAARFGRPAPGGTLIPITLRQDDLASLAGTSRETANRAIRRLTERGRIQVERRGRYVVRSPMRLVRP
jgi:CRP/FNR family transcriptional regulator, cyclic AMP receptor protein